MDKACQVFFKINVPPERFCDYYIRGELVYCMAENLIDNVVTCSTHLLKDQNNGKGNMVNNPILILCAIAECNTLCCQVFRR